MLSRHTTTAGLALSATLLAAALGLAGCSVTPTPTDSTAPRDSSSTPTDASDSPSSAAPAASGALDGDALCALVSVDEANAATTISPAFTQQASGTFVDGEPECGFADDASSVIVNVTVFDAATTPLDLSSSVASGKPLSAVSGLGDAAGVNVDEVDVALGDRTLVVETFADIALSGDQLIALATIFAGKL